MGRTKGSGQGSVYKRGDKWRGQITVNGERLSFTAKKKADVLDWLASVRMDDIKGLRPAKSNITVQELCDYWMHNVKSQTLAPQTWAKTDSYLRVHLYPVLGKYKVQDLTPQIIENAYPKMFDGEYSDGTVFEFSNLFKQFLKYAVKQNIITRNPHEDVFIRKRNNRKKVDAYTLEEQEKLVKYLKSAEPSPFNTMIYLLLATGMRVGEASALTWEDIDLGKGSINVRRTTVNIRGQISVQDHPKTASGVRTIYLSESAREKLSQFKSDRKEVHRSDFLFRNTKNGLYVPTNMQGRWKRTCAAAGIPYKGLHSLRHTFATRALEKGIDIKTVSSILGHKNVVTTMNLYQDVYSEHKIKVAEIMNDLF